jgi:hypothetical protein
MEPKESIDTLPSIYEVLKNHVTLNNVLPAIKIKSSEEKKSVDEKEFLSKIYPLIAPKTMQQYRRISKKPSLDVFDTSLCSDLHMKVSNSEKKSSWIFENNCQQNRGRKGKKKEWQIKITNFYK